MPILSDTEQLELLVERSTIPEQEPFNLPDDWRADKPQIPCRLCGWTGGWTGGWSDATRTLGRRPGYNEAMKTMDLEQSASDGNICCAVLFALAQKFIFLVGVSRFPIVWFQTQGSDQLMVNYESTRGKDIYVSSSSEEEVHAPPGVKGYTGHPFAEPWSEKTLAWAKTGVEDCALKHDCSTAFKSMRRLLPTRLIHIPDYFQARGIRLIDNTESLPQDTRYTALSHCWGKPNGRECLTTFENVARNSTGGINWTKVPQPFRDAIYYGISGLIHYASCRKMQQTGTRNQPVCLTTTRMHTLLCLSH